MVKYAEAYRVEIAFRVVKSNLQITVKDNGKGFVPKEVKRGNGLQNFQKHAQYLGGKIAIDSGIGAGTLISLSFPVSPYI